MSYDFQRFVRRELDFSEYEMTPAEVVTVAEHECAPIVRRYVGLSGGNDSVAVAHWMMNNVDGCEVVHCNTGIGIKRTREFVRDTCATYHWPLTEIRAKEDCGQDYRALVVEFGFPGPAGHQMMYNHLKDRCIEKLVRDAKAHLTGGAKRKARVMIATGIRKDESQRRMGYGLRVVNRRGAQVWTNPIYWWTASQRDAYRAAHRLPTNPISAALGMSGECLCGAYAHPGEKELVRAVCPETGAELDDIERDVLAAGHTWGWEGRPPHGARNTRRKPKFMPFCVGCEKVHDEETP